MNTVVRDKAWIEREYNQEKWPAAVGDAEKLIAAGETSLQRVVMQVEAARRSRSRIKVGEAEPCEITSFRQTCHIPRHLAQEGYYLLQAHLVGALAREDTDYVVELGSGLGLNLFRTWLSGGPRDANYIAFELTEAGRRCTEILAALEPEINCRALPFDFMAPDYSALPEKMAHMVVFSSQAIEQIPMLDPAVLTGLLDRSDDVSGIHFEPIGWQVPADRGGVDRDGSYAEKHDYSRNCWAVLSELESAGRIAIDIVDVDMFGVIAENPVTLITWRKTS